MYKDYVVFNVLGQEIALISDETSYGRNTVAEINGHYHYLDNELTTVSSAVFAWQEVNKRDLTSEELHQVLVDNQLICSAV
jgi:CO dehydrogenase/acetyl-CoA synthase alpha subunit